MTRKIVKTSISWLVISTPLILVNENIITLRHLYERATHSRYSGQVDIHVHCD